jgi:hypothetical protein
MPTGCTDVTAVLENVRTGDEGISDVLHDGTGP